MGLVKQNDKALSAGRILTNRIMHALHKLRGTERHWRVMPAAPSIEDLSWDSIP